MSERFTSYNRALKKRSKQRDVYKHLIKRIQQRFGFVPTKDDIQQAIKQIQKRKAKFVGFESRTRSAHIVKMKSHNMIVIYNREKKYLHTAFPVSWLNNTTNTIRASVKKSYSGVEYII